MEEESQRKAEKISCGVLIDSKTVTRKEDEEWEEEMEEGLKKG